LPLAKRFACVQLCGKIKVNKEKDNENNGFDDLQAKDIQLPNKMQLKIYQTIEV
jgi:hypothetical protein